jgi:[CysO sulfur-carrier protein]-S-L-cysteine hydrolase
MDMTILLPNTLRRRLEVELVRAGKNEIGGILMGRDLGDDTFRIEELQVQRQGGNFAFFMRQVQAFLLPLERFFDRTGHRYTEYNYLGEWHSHPSFGLVPSACDQTSMREIVEDPEVGAAFAVLLIVKLGKDRKLDARVYIFMPNQSYSEVTLHREEYE